MDITDKQKIWFALSQIPSGKVVTYGQLAILAGFSTLYARVVGNLLSQLPLGSDLPWHRVVNHKGYLSFQPHSERYNIQKERLKQEGVTFLDERILLQDFRWNEL